MERLKEYSTKQLVEELSGRAGVETDWASPYEYKIVECDGSAVVLVVTD